MCVRKTLIVAAMLSAGRLAAQTISGRIYDSVAKAPLAGAAIQLVSSKPGSGPPLQATSDGAGRFTLSNVAPGSYVLGVTHNVLDSIGIDPPFIRLEVSAGQGTTRCGSIVVWTKRFR